MIKMVLWSFEHVAELYLHQIWIIIVYSTGDHAAQYVGVCYRVKAYIYRKIKC